MPIKICGYHVEKVYKKIFESDNQIVRVTLSDYINKNFRMDLDSLIKRYCQRFL
jgi:hypothetical protein